MRALILAVVGIVSYLIIVLPGYFLFVPQDQDPLEELPGMEAMVDENAEMPPAPEPEAPGEAPPMNP